MRTQSLPLPDAVRSVSRLLPDTVRVRPDP